jgi:hypothetical protein
MDPSTLQRMVSSSTCSLLPRVSDALVQVSVCYSGLQEGGNLVVPLAARVYKGLSSGAVSSSEPFCMHAYEAHCMRMVALCVGLLIILASRSR